MNSNYDLTLTCTASYKDETIELTFDPYNDCASLEDLQDMAEAEFNEQFPDLEIEDSEDIEIEITDYDEIPSNWQNITDLWEFAAAFAECDQEIEVVVAAFDCGVDPDNIDEAYSGQFGSDEDFAEDMADQLGLIDNNAAWPQNCIDWEIAAKELMYDYNESNGYYFRSM